jgi:hypothetical protein
LVPAESALSAFDSLPPPLDDESLLEPPLDDESLLEPPLDSEPEPDPPLEPPLDSEPEPDPELESESDELRLGLEELPDRSLRAQPLPLKWTAGATIAFFIGPPQTGQAVGPSP